MENEYKFWIVSRHRCSSNRIQLGERRIKQFIMRNVHLFPDGSSSAFTTSECTRREWNFILQLHEHLVSTTNSPVIPGTMKLNRISFNIPPNWFVLLCLCNFLFRRTVTPFYLRQAGIIRIEMYSHFRKSQFRSRFTWFHFPFCEFLINLLCKPSTVTTIASKPLTRIRLAYKLVWFECGNASDYQNSKVKLKMWRWQTPINNNDKTSENAPHDYSSKQLIFYFRGIAF